MNALRLYRALVIETNDPEGLGRVKLRTLRPERGTRRRREGWASVANYPIAAFVLRPPYAVDDEVLYAAEKFPFTGAVVLCLRQRSAASADLPMTVAVEPNGAVTIQSTSQLRLQASQLIVTASSVQVDTGDSRFSGLVRCETLLTNSVISSSYTPGAGNIW
jgi:hypothetical protein